MPSGGVWVAGSVVRLLGRQAARDGWIMRRWCDGGVSDARQPVGAVGEPDPMFANAQTDPERPATLSPRWLDTPI